MTVPPLPEPAVIAAAKALHNTVFNADQGGYSACPCESADEHDEKWHADVVDARRALRAAVPLIAADGEMHELVFTDREARPAKWETRCGRTDIPLENAGSADPGMYYPVTCKACLRIAELERLADQMLAAFNRRSAIGEQKTRSGGVTEALFTRWLQVRHSGEAAVAAAEELAGLGEELQGGDHA